MGLTRTITFNLTATLTGNIVVEEGGGPSYQIDLEEDGNLVSNGRFNYNLDSWFEAENMTWNLGRVESPGDGSLRQSVNLPAGAYAVRFKYSAPAGSSITVFLQDGASGEASDTITIEEAAQDQIAELLLTTSTTSIVFTIQTNEEEGTYYIDDVYMEVIDA